jgi:hypothetical protein
LQNKSPPSDFKIWAKGDVLLCPPSIAKPLAKRIKILTLCPSGSSGNSEETKKTFLKKSIINCPSLRISLKRVMVPECLDLEDVPASQGLMSLEPTEPRRCKVVAGRKRCRGSAHGPHHTSHTTHTDKFILYTYIVYNNDI